MLAFFWILGAMGVAYGARLSGRGPWPWFAVGLVLTPLGGSLVLMGANRLGWFVPR